ncbi:MAG: 3-deoxy-manno-octulosonate cytidylyltransferase [bacterium]|nr:3-deoxy-manno-octulosonate cytidylyltransferase [bacterium]
MKAIGVIPSRLGATRFPRKPLALIAGKPMIVRVLERAKLATRLDRVIVATDSEEIATVVRNHQGEVILTDSALPSGTDRIGAAVRDLDAEIMLNIQGDEPAMDPATIDAIVYEMQSDATISIATPALPMDDPELFMNPAAVKVVIDCNRNALYFSRAKIPFPRNHGVEDIPPMYLHLGLYGYRRDALDWFCQHPPSPLERRESLEQLRFLEAGWKIRVVLTDAISIGVDTPEDVARVEKILRDRNIP